jgi:CRP-like cAMP-binding protein
MRRILAGNRAKQTLKNMHAPDINQDPAKEGSSSAKERTPMSQSLFELIKKQPFFKGLDSRQLQLLTDSAMEMQFEAGETIMKEGDPANRFYLILEGKVVLESEIKDRGMVPIQTIGPGDDLGWSWLFPPYYMHFTARALKLTRTIFFYGTPLREQCEQDHELGYQLLSRVAEVATKCLRSTQQRLAECTDTTRLPKE